LPLQCIYAFHVIFKINTDWLYMKYKVIGLSKEKKTVFV
jgi:hypothetical protein